MPLHPENEATSAVGWLLSTPRLTLTSAEGDPLPVRAGAGQFTALADTAESALGQSPAGTAVVGALPFDEAVPAHLWLTRLEHHEHPPAERAAAVGSLSLSPPLSFSLPLPYAEAVPYGAEPNARRSMRLTEPQPNPQPSAYRAAVRAVLAEIESGTVRKAVLARSLHVPLNAADHRAALVPALITALARREAAAHVFAVTLPTTGPHGVAPPLLLGATPETLLRRTGDLLTLRPLAGTAARHPDPVVDRARAMALLRSGKNQAEHRHVVDDLARRLRPWCRSLDIPARPRLQATGRLWHLATPIHARLRHPAPSALTLACALHPTPAVCGTPTPAAAAVIRRLEAVPRRYFSGLVGWMDKSGDGHWVISLRCGELDADGLRLHAGAGIVRASRPESELAETEAKFATMLAALDEARLAALDEARSSTPRPRATPARQTVAAAPAARTTGDAR